MKLQKQKKAWLVFLLTTVGLGACGISPVNETSLSGNEDFAEAMAQSADATLIVDCLLPGKIKKMGSAMTYLTPRRPVKTSSQNCEIRGGEYVAYDRANYKTALRVWQPMAEQGDQVAQTYVGAIYEKGLGVSPDYAKAAGWYKKAAEQGYSRAQYALGYLYEMGQGVEKNPQKAFRWYRLAAGLTQEDIRLAHVELSEQERQKLEQAIAAEEALLKKVEQQLVERKQALGQVDQQIGSAKTDLKNHQMRLSDLAEKEQVALARHERETAPLLLAWKEKANQLEVEVQGRKQVLSVALAELLQKQHLLQEKETQLATAVSHFEKKKDRLQKEKQQLVEKKEQVVTATRPSATVNRVEINNKIKEKEQQLSAIDLELIRQNRLAQQKGQELKILLSAVADKKQEQQDELNKLAKRSEEIKVQQEQLATKRSVIEQQWAAERTQHVAKLKKQSAVIATLEKQQKNNNEKLAYLNRAQNKQQLALLAPKIELIDPDMPIMRSVNTVTPVFRIRGETKEKMIIGKVISDNDLLMVAMNEQTVELNHQGVFKTTLNIPKKGTLVDIVAVDVDGNRSELKFVLSPEPDTEYETTRSVNPMQDAPPLDNAISQIEFGDYYALLIGNNDYKQMPQLITPIKDVEAISDILQSKYGFKETIILKNATRYDILTAMNKLRKRLTDKDNLVIYYAGHGELDRVNMTGQWLPVDAEVENTANWISNSSLTELINAISAKHVLVVADSCYSGILTRSALTQVSANKSDLARLTWLKKMAKKRARLVLSSGGVAPVLDEGGGEHSLFARAFLDALENNNKVLDGQQLFRTVSAAVAIAADRYKVDQVPEYAPMRHAGHESGDFFLVPTNRI
ncbi:MAG: hypothetical protein GXP14_00025 [Gammaproteobacteria bacterium]|nr:hypothetical protein [Gammaproteobacteria bacterium]